MSDPNDFRGFSAPAPEDLAPLFPGYHIESLIATGGMGAVYRAVQRSLDRTVALKILPVEFSQDAAFCAGFEAEAKAMARLNHPNLIGVYDFGEVGGMLYIIMEYVPGQSLYHAAYGQAIDPPEVVRLVSAICHGLAHAHENGIIHRDIKPSNILLDLNAQPKIGDFGLARPADRTIEEGEEIFGTPHYTAPEVVDSPHSVDHRADIFSVGVLLHELLTGQLPASDPRPASVIARCDPRFDTIVRRATQHLATARYGNAAEMAKDLQAAAPRSPTQPAAHVPQAAAPRRPGSPHHATRKKSSGTTGVLFLGLALAGGVGAYLHFSRPVAPAKPAKDSGIVLVPSGGTAQPPATGTQSDPGKTASSDPAAPPPGSEQPAQPEPAVTHDPAPAAPVETPPTETVAPKADVAALFANARKNMQEQARSPISEYTSKMRGNLSSFQTDAARAITRMKSDRQKYQTSLEEESASWKSAGNRLPNSVPSSLADIPGIQEIHSEAARRQSGYESAFTRDLGKFSGTYIAGLQKKIAQYQQTGDPGAAAALQTELQQVQADPAYFRGLMVPATPQ